MTMGSGPTSPLGRQPEAAQPALPVQPPPAIGQAADPSTIPPNPFAPLAPGPAVAPPDRRRRSWIALMALSLSVLLLGIVVWQGLQIRRLGQQLDDTHRQMVEAENHAASRIDTVERRVAALEDQAGKAFNAEKIAEATLPSVFRVSAGDFTGTAFAIGANTGKSTDFLTNYHVVQQVWQRGDDIVYLERANKRYRATIVKVDERADIAHLRTTQSFDRLKAASTKAKPGQQVVVVGAPYGLEDTVTTGVISALREPEEDLPGAIQFDAAINPGNSGGPVINAQHEVVGIATAVLRDTEGIGLAVPIGIACEAFRIC